MNVTTVVFIYFCLIFRFFFFSRMLLGQNLFVTDRKYGKLSFMNRINENLCFNFY